MDNVCGKGLSYLPLPLPEDAFKNERANFRTRPAMVPAWFVDMAHHPLCSVAALRHHVSNTASAPEQSLYVHPTFLTPLHTLTLTAQIHALVRRVDPRANPRAHVIQGLASTTLLLRFASLNTMAKAGQWSSTSHLCQPIPVTPGSGHTTCNNDGPTVPPSCLSGQKQGEQNDSTCTHPVREPWADI